MINFNKGVSSPIAITIIIVLAVILIGGVFAYQYYYLPRQEIEISKPKIPKDETQEKGTADWKTYRNEEYGFEIEYPKDWRVNIEEDSTPQKDISIFFYKETTSDKLKFVLLINKYAEIDTFRPPTETKEIIVGGIKTTSYSYIFDDSNFLVIYGFCVDKNFKEVSLTSHDCVLGNENFFYYQFFLSCQGENWQGEDGLKQCAGLFSQMLSTFKFTD